MIAAQMAVAVFEDRGDAELAVATLHQAGFQPDQIALARQRTREEMRVSDAAPVSPPSGVVAGLARYVTGLMGLADNADRDGADFEGRTIIRVKAADRCEEAMTILQHHGGYNRRTDAAARLEAGLAKPVWSS